MLLRDGNAQVISLKYWLDNSKSGTVEWFPSLLVYTVQLPFSAKRCSVGTGSVSSILILILNCQANTSRILLGRFHHVTTYIPLLEHIIYRCVSLAVITCARI
jgi:hypothetical protein